MFRLSAIQPARAVRQSIFKQHCKFSGKGSSDNGRDTESILTGQVLLFAAEYDFATHTVPDYVPVLILMTGLLEVEFAPALLGLVLVPLPFVAGTSN